MPPSNGNALSAAVKNHQDKAAFNAQQAVADKQKQKEIEILAQKSKLYTDRAKDVVSQKLRLERELKESQQQRQQVASKPPQTPSAQAPAMTQEEINQSGPTFLGEYRFDFGAWNGAYISRVPEDYLRSCAGNNGVMRKRPELLKALFERNNAKLLNRNEMCSLEDATENQNTLQQMSSSSAIASSSPPAVFSSSPLPQFGSASSPPSSPSKAHMPEWLINFNARAAKMDRPMTAPVRPALTEAGPSTPAANTRAKSKGKAKAKAKGKGKTATYIKIEPLDTPSGVVKRRPGRPRKTVVPTQEATGPRAKKQLTLDDYKVAAHASHATPLQTLPMLSALPMLLVLLMLPALQRIGQSGVRTITSRKTTTMTTKRMSTKKMDWRSSNQKSTRWILPSRGKRAREVTLELQRLLSGPISGVARRVQWRGHGT
ncbi:hypothetical protein P3342_006986 [Pyrenophora teres f. teres]|nr:hypothetical protein P3342_006986 [Pyrenophora teres f. teres]